MKNGVTGRSGAMRAVAGCLAIAIMLLGCSKGEKTQAGGELKPITRQPADQIAQVNGQAITLGEVDRIVNAWRAGHGRNMDPNTPEAEMQKQAVDQLIGQYLLYQAAEKAGTVPSDEEVQSLLDQFKQSRNLDDASFEAGLKQQGLTAEEFAKNFKIDQAIRRFVQATFQDTMKITPEQAQAYFDQHPEQFQHPEQVHARHILLRVDSTADAATSQQIERRAEGIYRDLMNGADFAALAKEKSEDRGSAVNGGDLGFFSRGQMVAPFDSVAFALKPGETSHPVRTQFGYHIIRVEDHAAAGAYAFADIQPQLTRMLHDLRSNQCVDSLVSELKGKASIKRKI